MAQFTAASLARLLANVEREVLVEALERAGMAQLLTSAALETLEELQFRLNQLTNLETFGPALLKARAKEFRAEVISVLPMFLKIPFRMFFLVEQAVDSIRTLIEDLPEEIEELVPPEISEVLVPLDATAETLQTQQTHIAQAIINLNKGEWKRADAEMREARTHGFFAIGWVNDARDLLNKF